MRSRQQMKKFSIAFSKSSFSLLKDWLWTFFSMGWSSGWKFAKEKKSSYFAYFYLISLYKIDPRTRFHEIRYLDPILPGNAFIIWFFLTPMIPCNFLWGSISVPPPKIFQEIKLWFRLISRLHLDLPVIFLHWGPFISSPVTRVIL